MNGTSRQPAGRAGRKASVVIIGAGHAGLAMSRCLGNLGVDHVLLERGEVANAWRHERWDSLRLLTPNWQCRLPGLAYDGNDPDGYLTMPEVIAFMDRYARFIDAPVHTGTRVTSVSRQERGYRVATNQGLWWCDALVMATGAFNRPVIPACSSEAPASVLQYSTREYRNPAQLPPGGVLVVGGSATGLQLARELQQSGRQVWLATGEHVRLPRTYRGRDIQWWMDAVGLLDERYDQVDDLSRVRRVPSPQLIGSPERASLDLNSLMAQGVRITGRLMGISQGRALFSGSLANVCALADLKMGRLLARIDEWASASGLEQQLPPAERFAPTRIDASPCLSLNLHQSGIQTIVWATGFRPDYAWLDVPVLDHKGQLRHDGGVVASPGLYVMGLPFMRRRKSSFIHGAEDDARDLSAHLFDYLNRQHGQVRTSVPVAWGG